MYYKAQWRNGITAHGKEILRNVMSLHSYL
jgi:hypothetical protein